MNNKNNGDVTSIDNQKEFYNRCGSTVDLYTSDLGFDVSSDYNKQEELHAHANLGQIITGLLVLKKGGSLLTKQYTYFEPFTVSLMGALTLLFEHVYICKPMFSKPANSETYIVCKNYYGVPKNVFESNSIHRQLLDRLGKWSFTPLTTKRCLSNSFTSTIIKSHTMFTNIQIRTINKILSEYVKIKNGGTSTYFPNVIKRDLQNWCSVYTIKKNRNRLNVREIMGVNPKHRHRPS